MSYKIHSDDHFYRQISPENQIFYRYAAPNSHFMAESSKMGILLDDFPTLSNGAKELWSFIVPIFDTFCFCRRHLEHENIPFTEEALDVWTINLLSTFGIIFSLFKELVAAKLLSAHPPLVDQPGTYNAHFVSSCRIESKISLS